MRHRRVSLCAWAVFCLCLLVSLSSADEPAPNDIPVVGRPSDLPFSGASGWFDVWTRAEPTNLEAETPLTFTLSVHAKRETRRAPQRIDLRQLPAFEKRFYIEDVGETPSRPDKATWEFAYRLKPRRTDVSEIPGLPFVYFNPYLRTSRKGFQVVYTDPIPLRVLSHETVQVPVQAPANAFVLAMGPAVLERQTEWTPPRTGTMGLLLLTPPIVCVIWYLCWCRWYPDAARQARQRRSRAARRALRMLRGARRLDVEPRAARTAAVIAGYLRERLELTVAEPTPREAALFFERRGCSPALTARAVRLFEACDRARFLPAAESKPVDLTDAGVAFILAVEAET